MLRFKHGILETIFKWCTAYYPKRLLLKLSTRYDKVKRKKPPHTLRDSISDSNHTGNQFAISILHTVLLTKFHLLKITYKLTINLYICHKLIKTTKKKNPFLYNDTLFKCSEKISGFYSNIF